MSRSMGEHWGNPSSAHAYGFSAREAMEHARETLMRQRASAVDIEKTIAQDPNRYWLGRWREEMGRA